MNECVDTKYIEPMDLLPLWAYTNSEWDDIVNQTVCIIDGTRYMKKEPEQLRLEDIEAFADSILI